MKHILKITVLISTIFFYSGCTPRGTPEAPMKPMSYISKENKKNVKVCLLHDTILHPYTIGLAYDEGINMTLEQAKATNYKYILVASLNTYSCKELAPGIHKFGKSMLASVDTYVQLDAGNEYYIEIYHSFGGGYDYQFTSKSRFMEKTRDDKQVEAVDFNRITGWDTKEVTNN